jgi:hypothetical protein
LVPIAAAIGSKAIFDMEKMHRRKIDQLAFVPISLQFFGDNRYDILLGLAGRMME